MILAPTVLCALIFGVSLTSSFPAESTPADGNRTLSLNSSFFSSSNSLSSANGFNVIVTQHDDNGHCITTLGIRGHGIDKRVEYPCQKEQPFVINSNKSLLVDNYFTDTRGILIHLVDDKCEKEVFEEIGGKYSSKVEPMGDKDCEKVKVKIEILKEEHVKWEAWYREQQALAQQQFTQIQQQLMNLQQSLFGNLFGFWG